MQATEALELTRSNRPHLGLEMVGVYDLIEKAAKRGEDSITLDGLRWTRLFCKAEAAAILEDKGYTVRVIRSAASMGRSIDRVEICWRTPRKTED